MKSLLIRATPGSDPTFIQFDTPVELSNMLQSKMLLGSLDQATAHITWMFFQKGFKSVVMDGSAVYELTEVEKVDEHTVSDNAG